jgi:hypothetical protein
VKLKIAAVQMRSTNGEVKANLDKAEGLVREAAQAGAKLVVLPELFNTGYGYTPANYELTETPDGQTYRWVVELAAELDIHLAGSFCCGKGVMFSIHSCWLRRAGKPGSMTKPIPGAGSGPTFALETGQRLPRLSWGRSGC